MRKLFYLLLLLATTSASAQYVSHGPSGGVAYSFYHDAGRTWMASNTGVFYSSDEGRSWNSVLAPATVFNCEPVVSIAAAGNELYAGGQRSGIYHSVDGGDNWSMVNTGLERSVAYSDLEIAGPNALAIRADSGVLYLTPNHGAAWVRVNFTINNAQALWLSIHNNAVYATTSQGLFKSIDNGQTFTNINPSVGDIGELTWSNDTAYVSTVTGIKQSVDDGVSFTTIGLAGRPTQNIAVAGSAIFATVRSANRDTLKYSVNGGASFSDAVFPTSVPFGLVHDITIAGSHVLAGTDYGVYQSPVSSGSFRKADSDFHSTVIRSMAVNGLRLYTASYPMGVSFTQDSAETWKHNGDLAHGLEGDMLTIDAKNQYVHAGGQLNYYRSSDFGSTWTAGAARLPSGTINSIYASKTSRDVLVLRSGNLYRSSDDGASFIAVVSGVPATTAYLITPADTTVFIAASGNLYKGNSSYAFTAVTGIPNQVTSVVYRGGVYFASTSGSGLFTSVDGSAWRPEVILAPGTLPLKLNALVVNNNALIAATDDGLYSDSTGVWQQDSLQGIVVRSLAVMDGKTYAGTCRGVWSRKNRPAPVVSGVGGLNKAGSALQAYPNPSSGDFRLAFTAAQAGAGVLTLRNIIGHTVLHQSLRLHTGRNDLKVSAASMQLPAGMYLLQLTTDDQSATQRIIVR